MIRAVQTDFGNFEKFVSNYQIADLLENAIYLDSVKQGHVAYLSLLTLWALIQYRSANGGINIGGQHVTNAHESIVYIREAVSDVGSSLFCCLHGAYKPGHMSMRSAVENYVRGISGVFDPKVFSTTSVFELFDLAKLSVPFKTTEGKKTIAKLIGSYKELCKYTHSATLAHMANINSLDHFPSMDEHTFKAWSKEAKKCVAAMIYSWLASTPGLYSSCDFRSRDLLDISLTPEQRVKLMGG